jgi:hypothetical protein
MLPLRFAIEEKPNGTKASRSERTNTERTPNHYSFLDLLIFQSTAFVFTAAKVFPWFEDLVIKALGALSLLVCKKMSICIRGDIAVKSACGHSLVAVAVFSVASSSARAQRCYRDLPVEISRRQGCKALRHDTSEHHHRW